MKWCGGRALKVCVVGNPGVGKTSLVRYLSEGRFEELYITTVGANARTVTVGGTVPGVRRQLLSKLTLWDVTGHAGPEALEQYVRGARAALVVADATRLDTQLDMWKWVEGLRMAGRAEGARDIMGRMPIFLVVSKSDVAGPDFDSGPVAELSREYGIPYRLVSARSGQNVLSVFFDLARRLVRPWAAMEPKWPPRPPAAMKRPEGRLDRWDFSAGFWPGDPGPAGWPDPHGSCVVGSAGRVRI